MRTIRKVGEQTLLPSRLQTDGDAVVEGELKRVLFSRTNRTDSICVNRGDLNLCILSRGVEFVHLTLGDERTFLVQIEELAQFKEEHKVELIGGRHGPRSDYYLFEAKKFPKLWLCQESSEQHSDRLGGCPFGPERKELETLSSQLGQRKDFYNPTIHRLIAVLSSSGVQRLIIDLEQKKFFLEK